MRKNLSILLFLFLSIPLFSQETNVLKGKIIADSLMQGSIHIVNLTRKTGTINSEAGFFELKVSENDTLLFSSVQYEIKEVVITPEIIEKKYMQIELAMNINELAEVKISNISLTGDLERDVAGIEIVEPVFLGLPNESKVPISAQERRLYTASSGPIDYLVNTLNGRIKMLKKAKANSDLQNLVYKGMDMLPKGFYIKELNIPEEHIINFVYFCAEDPEFKNLIMQNQLLEITEFYQEKAPVFLQTRLNK